MKKTYLFIICAAVLASQSAHGMQRLIQSAKFAFRSLTPWYKPTTEARNMLKIYDPMDQHAHQPVMPRNNQKRTVVDIDEDGIITAIISTKKITHQQQQRTIEMDQDGNQRGETINMKHTTITMDSNGNMGRQESRTTVKHRYLTPRLLLAQLRRGLFKTMGLT